ncbi:copper chaperone PCu(A)C [Pseudonocardia humida]|uniref:Copper chaperone PCu(A)C n=1 Tax=Pseudonocardia humida TaxID=2800819 RepID=A0ABT0ZY56_9PSEU|nr:copper chaperone PCu(A)C [Pseudonocardia humida]MCO1655623.1 copper chaperone PCu(A)C [Pseudonocardia humida]
MSPSVPAASVRARGALLVAALGALALAGCGAAPTTGPAAPTIEPAAAAAPAPQTAVVVSDPWVKAAEGGMTAVFGTVTATGSAPVTVVSAATSASPRAELHEVLGKADGTMAMQPKESGFVVDPGAPHRLAPGGDHIMIMDLAAPIRPGDRVEVTLTLGDGSTAGFSALAKETTAGEENYEHGEAAPGMSGPGGAPTGQGG